MGLFSNKKKLCPLCGGPTPRLLPTKVEGMPICKECDQKVDLPAGAIDHMTVEDLKKYMEFYDANAPLRAQFTETYRYGFGLFSGDLILDGTHRLLRVRGSDDAIVLEAKNIVSFRITENGQPLYEGKSTGLFCRDSDVPAQVDALRGRIDQFNLQRQQFEQMERLAEMMDRRDRDHGAPPPPPRPYRPRPSFDADPVRELAVEVTFRHPYWKSFRETVSCPSFNSDYPSADSFLDEYTSTTRKLYDLAVALIQLMDPNAKEYWNGDKPAPAPAPKAAPAAKSVPKPQAQPSAAPKTVKKVVLPGQEKMTSAASADDVAAELKKYKDLLDAGILTEEEFTAKKRQLLGI